MDMGLWGWPIILDGKQGHFLAQWNGILPATALFVAFFPFIFELKEKS
jgi:hypothetical protein